MINIQNLSKIGIGTYGLGGRGHRHTDLNQPNIEEDYFYYPYNIKLIVDSILLKYP